MTDISLSNWLGAKKKKAYFTEWKKLVKSTEEEYKHFTNDKNRDRTKTYFYQ